MLRRTAPIPAPRIRRTIGQGIAAALTRHANRLRRLQGIDAEDARWAAVKIVEHGMGIGRAVSLDRRFRGLERERQLRARIDELEKLLSVRGGRVLKRKRAA